MNENWHRISDVDAEARRGTCSVCGPVRLRRRVRNGNVEWSCGVKHRQQAGVGARPHRRGIRERGWCSRCGFMAAHHSQLDVHHVNGDHDDNAAENLEVLCANCHRLEHVNPAGLLGHSFTARDIQATITIVGLLEFIRSSGLELPNDAEIQTLASAVAARHTKGAAA